MSHEIAVTLPGLVGAVQTSSAQGRTQHEIMPVPYMILHHMDSLLAERIRVLARERQCPVNDILLQALRNGGLGMLASQQFSESWRNPQMLTALDGHWAASEFGAFQEALQALVQSQPTQFAPENIRFDEFAAGAE